MKYLRKIVTSSCSIGAFFPSVLRFRVDTPLHWSCGLQVRKYSERTLEFSEKKRKAAMAANNILMLKKREEMRAEKALETAFKVEISFVFWPDDKLISRDSTQQTVAAFILLLFHEIIFQHIFGFNLKVTREIKKPYYLHT